MKARFVNVHNQVCVTWLDSHGEGLPVEIHHRAWRRCTYRKPIFDTKREPLPIPNHAGVARTNAVLNTTTFE